MSRKYQQYMDRQRVSPELHRRLMALEQQGQPRVQPVRWQRWVALAASLVLVIGVTAFAATRFGPGSVSNAGEKASMTAAEGAQEAAEADTAVAVVMDSAQAQDALAAPESAEREEALEEAALDTEAVDDVEALMEYATDYLGDAPNVSHIAAGMTYPEGWAYDYIELHTRENAPYSLDIHLTAASREEADTQAAGEVDYRKAFRDNAHTAFTLIGNVEVVCFMDGHGNVLAEFKR